MVTLSLWFPLLFLSRVFASILVRSGFLQSLLNSTCAQVSEVYWGQGECDTAVDPVRAPVYPVQLKKSYDILLRTVQEQEGSNAMHRRSRFARPMQRKRFGVQQLVSTLLHSKRMLFMLITEINSC